LWESILCLIDCIGVAMTPYTDINYKKIDGVLANS
jgi:hypothetical protein